LQFAPYTFFELIGWIDASNTNWYWNSKWWKDFFSDNTVQANVVSLANFVVLIQTGITIIESVTLCVNTVLTPVYKLVDLVSSMWNTTPVTKGKHTNDHKEQTCMQKKQRKEKRRRKVCKRKGKTCKRKQKGSKKKQEASNNTTPTSEGWITTLVKMLLDALWYIIMAFLVVVFYILSKGLTEFCKMGKRILKGVRNATKTSLSWVCNVAVPGVWRHVCIMGRYVLNRVDEYKQALEAQRRQAEQETQRRQAEAEEAARLLEAQRRQAEQETQRRQAEAEEAARLLEEKSLFDVEKRQNWRDDIVRRLQRVTMITSNGEKVWVPFVTRYNCDKPRKNGAHFKLTNKRKCPEYVSEEKKYTPEDFDY